MSVTGIICEYNPFHKGHEYHIRQARKQTGADTIVAVMNGDFVQRGEPAIVDKYVRAKMALAGGADLVFELPVRYGISSAEDFAYGGILALESLGFVDDYCFGSESLDSDLLFQAGTFFAQESEEYRQALGVALREGLSFPAARERAFRQKVGRQEPEVWTEEVIRTLFSPNNILALEYQKAAHVLASKMKPMAVKRQGMGYHDTVDDVNITKRADDEYLSATAIREWLHKGMEEEIVGMSKEAATQMWEAGYQLSAEDFWNVCAYGIRDKWEELETYKDISEELADVFRKNWYSSTSFYDFVNRCKTKNITMSRVKRGVFQILLEVKKSDSREKKLPYIRLLGMRREAASLLGEIRDPVLIGRVAKDGKQLDLEARKLLEQDIRAADLYRSVAMAKTGREMSEEYRRPVLVV